MIHLTISRPVEYEVRLKASEGRLGRNLDVPDLYIYIYIIIYLPWFQMFNVAFPCVFMVFPWL